MESIQITVRRKEKQPRHGLPLGERIPAGLPLDHGGQLRRDRRLTDLGPLPPLPGAGGHHRHGRPRPGGALQLCDARTLPPRSCECSRAGRPSPTGRRGPTGVPSATRSTSSGMKTPASMDTTIPAFPPTATPYSSAAPTMPPRGGPWPRDCRAPPPVGHRCGQRHQLANRPSATSPTRFPGTIPPPGIRRRFTPKANPGPRMRASVRSCRCYPLR